MVTRLITQQTIRQGTESLAIFGSAKAYYVVHINTRQTITPVADPSRFEDYTSAHDRLQQEFHARQQPACTCVALSA